MKINFIKILTKPLMIKNFSKLSIKLLLLFLPSILAINFLGVESWVSRILFLIPLIILNGYLWVIFQNEAENESDDYPEFNFVRNFAIGIKGIMFFLASLALLITLGFILWMLASYMPDQVNIVKIIGIITFIYWLFMFYTVAMGMFADAFNPGEALKISTIVEVINGSWIDYLKAALYLLGYSIIIGLVCWACTIFFGSGLYYFTLAFFIIYAFIVYFSLYAKVFKEIKTDFESHF